MKKLLAVAVALCIAVPSTFAAWDYFPVIEGGSVEANINSGARIKIRYGLMDNLELFSANEAANHADYTIGARYQIVPDMLSAYLDLGIPASNGSAPDIDLITGEVTEGDPKDWGLTPGVQFSTSFTETISLGAGLWLPLHLNCTGAGDNGDDGLMVDLGVGVEFDFALSEQVTLWLGVDFIYDRLSQENREDLEIKDALQPSIGLTLSKDNLSVCTSLGIGLNAKTDKGDDTIALKGGVDFGIKF
jgi:hypothetical protein